jgi:predicted nucleotidyltransferase component of viral defense system
LYQRRKGRDLFDIWYVVTNELINLNQVFDIFNKYCTYNNVKITGEEFIKNLEQKKDNRDFHIDMSLLLPTKLDWHFEEAYQFVVNLINRLP